MTPYEEIIQLANQISSTRMKLQELEDRFRRLVSERRNPTSPTTKEIVIEDDVPLPQTFTDRVIAFLESNPTRAWSPNEVASRMALPPDQKPTLRSTLHRLCDEGRVERPNRGVYRAKHRNVAAIQ
jgi:hypothetical protein